MPVESTAAPMTRFMAALLLAAAPSRRYDDGTRRRSGGSGSAYLAIRGLRARRPLAAVQIARVRCRRGRRQSIRPATTPGGDSAHVAIRPSRALDGRDA